MPARSAALGSFHVKSWSTSLVKLLTTVRVLPFFLTVTFFRSTILLASTFWVRSYSVHRYSSMQISTTRHSSRGSALGTASRVSSGIGSDVLPNVATSTGGPSNSGSRHVPDKTTAPIAAWATPASRPSAIGATSKSSVSVQPKSANPATAQPAKATVPHNAAKVTNRGGVIMPPLAPPEPSAQPNARQCGLWDQDVAAQGRKPLAATISCRGFPCATHGGALVRS